MLPLYIVQWQHLCNEARIGEAGMFAKLRLMLAVWKRIGHVYDGTTLAINHCEHGGLRLDYIKMCRWHGKDSRLEITRARAWGECGEQCGPGYRKREYKLA